MVENTNAKKRNKKVSGSKVSLVDGEVYLSPEHDTVKQCYFAAIGWRFCYNVAKYPQEGTSCIYVDPVHQNTLRWFIPAATDDATDSLHLVQRATFFVPLEARSDPGFACPCKKYNWHAELTMAEIFERPKDQNHSLYYLVQSFDYVDGCCKEIEGKKSTWDYVSSQARGEG